MKLPPKGMPRRPDPRGSPPAPLVEKIGPPVARSPWSRDFAVQAIEVIPVFTEAGSLFWLKPVHAESLQIGLAKGGAPAAAVLDAIAWYELRPRVVHSTSWRATGDRIVLTYLVVVEPPDTLPADSLVRLPVERAELARAKAMAAPDGIAVAAVVEHALRHLRWLLGDDPEIRVALAGWTPLLAGYEPEPFRAL